MLTPETLDRLEAQARAQVGREIGTGVNLTPGELLPLVRAYRAQCAVLAKLHSSADSLGRAAYEAAAAVTDCDQPWTEANQAKWIAAAAAVVRVFSGEVSDE